jgi:prepilin-type N-terminal cleavage/methylation domain-containing protein
MYNIKLETRSSKRGHRGFTLVELLVVIAIIAILSVTAYVALGGQTGKARDSRRQSDLSAVQSALEIYAVNNGSQYPGTLDVLVTDGIMPEQPMDPTTGDPYVYEPSGNNRQYLLAATLEGEDGNYTAYVIGSGDASVIFMNDGYTYDSGAGTCSAVTNCTIADESLTCIPYCL